VMHIDIHSVLRQTVSCDLYSNLVTRPTGAAVRTQIEHMLHDVEERSLTVIDLSQVNMLDFSCADEVVAKLLLRYEDVDAPRDAYFLFRGVTDDHWEAIGSVLHRHGLALVLERDGDLQLAGVVADAERRMWEAVRGMERAFPTDVAGALGGDDTAEEVEIALDALWRRRLVIKVEGGYVAVGKGRG
jgi:hypothetical protein